MVNKNEILIIVGTNVLTQVPEYSSYFADIENGILYTSKSGEELKRMKTYERPEPHNYVTVTLTDDNGNTKCMGVHEAIVAAREQSWEWKMLHGLEVDHVNEKKNDNRGYINLELKSHAEQYTESVRAKISEKKRGSNHHSAKLNEDDVLEIRLRFREWEGLKQHFIRDVAEEFNLSESAVSALLYGQTWTHI